MHEYISGIIALVFVCLYYHAVVRYGPQGDTFAFLEKIIFLIMGYYFGQVRFS